MEGEVIRRDYFDLALAYRQWQGSGRHENLPRGAQAAANVCGQYAPLAHVSQSDDDSDAHGINRWGAILEQFRNAQDLLSSHAPRRLLTAGGDCAVDIAAIDYLNRIHRDLSVIWVDAHLDANTPATSPSGNFHGMPVSAIMGCAPEPMRRLLHMPIAPAQFSYVGVRVGDEGDWAFQREQKLAMLDSSTGRAGPVHIHFDLDVLDPDEFPYLAYPEPGGLPIGEAIALVRRIAGESEIVGFTVTEFAPASDLDASEGSKVIARLCAAAAGK